MSTVKKRRLHVWEHPSLHPAEWKKSSVTPVHLIFEDDEYDFWDVVGDGALCIGLVFAINPKNIPGYKGDNPVRREVRYRVSPGMFAKVEEEHYEEEIIETPLYDLETDKPELGAREQFNKRLHPDIPLVAHIDGPQPMDGWLPAETDLEPAQDDHTTVLPAIPVKVDEGTGVNLTNITRQVDPLLFSPPPMTETRLDLHSPMLLLPIVGSEKQDKKDSE